MRFRLRGDLLSGPFSRLGSDVGVGTDYGAVPVTVRFFPSVVLNFRVPL